MNSVTEIDKDDNTTNSTIVSSERNMNNIMNIHNGINEEINRDRQNTLSNIPIMSVEAFSQMNHAVNLDSMIPSLSFATKTLRNTVQPQTTKYQSNDDDGDDTTSSQHDPINTAKNQPESSTSGNIQSISSILDSEPVAKRQKNDSPPLTVSLSMAADISKVNQRTCLGPGQFLTSSIPASDIQEITSSQEQNDTESDTTVKHPQEKHIQGGNENSENINIDRENDKENTNSNNNTQDDNTSKETMMPVKNKGQKRTIIHISDSYTQSPSKPKRTFNWIDEHGNVLKSNILAPTHYNAAQKIGSFCRRYSKMNDTCSDHILFIRLCQVGDNTQSRKPTDDNKDDLYSTISAITKRVSENDVTEMSPLNNDSRNTHQQVEYHKPQSIYEYEIYMRYIPYEERTKFQIKRNICFNPKISSRGKSDTSRR